MTAVRKAWIIGLDGLSGRSRLVLTAGAGLAALATMLAWVGQPEDGAAAAVPPVTTPAAQAAAGDATQVAAKPVPAGREQRVLTAFLAKRFRVAHDAAGTFVAAAFRAGTEYRVDPLLVLAVVAVESRFNPVAESAVGATGLMQVLPKYHQDKLAGYGGSAALLDPVTNIDIGTQILHEYLRRGGNVRTGLQLYSGMDDDASVSQYAGKVLSELSRMQALLARERRTGA
jgi:soluble lytic murein transglycosylase-like protein